MESIEITWTPIDFPENGGDEYTGYTVLWGEGTPSAEWKVLAVFSTPVFRANTKKHGVSLVPLNIYKFKVYAFNSQGRGPDSLAFYTSTPQKG